MSNYGKRSATSPRENIQKRITVVTPPLSSMPPKKPAAAVRHESDPGTIPAANIRHESDPGTIVRIELETINEKPYFGQVSDEEVLYIWSKVFKRKIEELFGTTSTKSLTRNIRITYKLHAPVNVTEAFDGQHFRYQKFLDDGSVETVTGKIFGFGAKPAEIGEVTRITVKTHFGIEPSGIINWLKLYGTVAPQAGFVTNKNTGLKSDTFETEIVLKRHVEEFLPIYGQKCQVNYPGIPKMCNRCYKQGHFRRDCNNPKRDWVEYVKSFIDEEKVSVDYIGDWTKAIERWNNANAQKTRPEANK
jgi:hypothetical protein